MTDAALIFDAKKEVINFSWSHYCEFPEMKKHLKQTKNEHGIYSIADERTGDVVMSGTMPLDRFLK